MKKIALLFVLASALTTGTAQGVHYTDSLKLKLQKTVKDTNYIATLLNLADAIVYENPDSAMGYVLDALDLSKKLKSPKNIALSYNEIGIV